MKRYRALRRGFAAMTLAGVACIACHHGRALPGVAGGSVEQAGGGAATSTATVVRHHDEQPGSAGASSSAAASGSDPHRSGWDDEMPEDLNRDGVVDSLDSEAWVRAVTDRDPIADVDRNGVADDGDHERILAAIAAGKRAREIVPPVPGYVFRDLVKVEGVRLYIHHRESDGVWGYLTAPYRPVMARPSSTYTIASPLGATVTFDTDGSGRITGVRYADADGVRDAALLGTDLAAIEVAVATAELKKKLPPIGTCPGCVPIILPKNCDTPEYLYSKWGFFENCLMDFFGCTSPDGKGFITFTTACCHEPSPGTPDCDDFL